MATGGTVLNTSKTIFDCIANDKCICRVASNETDPYFSSDTPKVCYVTFLLKFGFRSTMFLKCVTTLQWNRVTYSDNSVLFSVSNTSIRTPRKILDLQNENSQPQLWVPMSLVLTAKIVKYRHDIFLDIKKKYITWQ